MARKTATTRKTKSKRNLDPLSTMALAQGTGIDRVVLGKRGFGEIGRALSGKSNPTEGRYIEANGVDDENGFGRVFIDVRRPDGSLIDTWREESLALSADQLWEKHGRKAFKALKSMYAVTEVRMPSQWKLRSKNPEDIEFLNDAAPYPSIGHIEFTQDGIERYARDGYVYQAFSSTPVFPDGYRMGAVEGQATEIVDSLANPTANKEFYFREMTPAGTPEHLRQFRLYTRAGKFGKFGQVDNMGVQGLTWTRESYVKRGYVEVAPQSENPHAIQVGDKWEYSYRTRKAGKWKDIFAAGTVSTVGADFVVIDGRTIPVGRVGSNGEQLVRSRSNPRRRNPQTESDAVYESFHGVPPSETLEVHETLHVHGHLAGLGDLCHLVVKLSAGTKSGKEIQLNAPDPAKAPDADIVRLTANEDKSTVYFVGGDQSLDLRALGFRESFDITHDGEKFEATDYKDNMIIGLVCRIMYRTQKSFDDFEMIDYHHLHGEDTSKYPTLTYDNLNQKMGMFGGEYAVAPEGIVN